MRTRKTRTLLILTMGVALPSSVLAGEDEEPIAPDRPGFGDAPRTVPAGHLQTEMGFQVDFDDDAQLSFPLFSFRVGLLDWLEVRVGVPDATATFGGSTTWGAGDATLGFMLARSFGEDLQASLVPAVSLPVGSAGATSGDYDPSLELNLAYALTEHLGLGAAGYVARAPLDDGTHGWALGAGASVGYAFTDSLSAYVEGFFEMQEGGDPQPSVGAGVAFLVTPRLQLDVSGGVGVTKDGAPPFVSSGLAVLW